MARMVEDFVSAHLDFAKGREGAPLYHKWSAMASLSAALERKVWLDRGEAGGIFYPNLYVILIGPAANGKTYAADLAIDHVKQVHRLLGESGGVNFTADKLTPAVLAEQLSEAEKSFGWGDRSHLHSPLFAYSGELAVYLTDIGGGSLVPDLLRYYDAGGTPELNIFQKRTISKGTVTIRNPSLVILGCTVPDYMRKVLAETSGYGFVSRSLFVVAYENPTVISDPKPEDKILQAKLSSTLAHIHTLTGPMEETEGATRAYRSWYVPFRAWFDDKRKAMNRVQAEYFGRKKVHVFKVAMLLSVSRGDSLTIEKEHIEEAIHLLDELELTMFSVTGSLDQKEDFYTRLERFFYLFPELPDTLEAKEVRRRSVSIFPTERDVLDALRRLKECDAIRSVEDPESKCVWYHRNEKRNPFKGGLSCPNGYLESPKEAVPPKKEEKEKVAAVQ